MKKTLCVLLVIVFLAGCGADVSFQQEKQTVQVQYSELRYFINQMEHEDYENFCAYYNAAANFESSCKLPHPVKQNRAEAMVSILQYECPELMMLDFTQGYSLYSQNEQVTEISVPLCVDAASYEDIKEQTEAAVRDLAKRCAGLSESETEKTVYDYIVSHCVYDETAAWAGTAYGCLVLGKAKCDGISAAMKWVLEEAGVKCITLGGEPVTGTIGHAWNVVCIDDNWYDVDVTADVNRQQESVPNYPAYNVSDRWIRDKYILSSMYEVWGPVPGADSMDGSYYAVNGGYVQTGKPDDLEQWYTEAYEQHDSFVLQFESQADFAAFEQELESRLERLGNQHKWSSWGWAVVSVPDYRTVRITATES